jgi:MFS family permease
MLDTSSPSKSWISKKIAIVNTVLLANAFVWYFYAFKVLKDIIAETGTSNVEPWLWSINFIGMALAAVFSASIKDKFKGRSLVLTAWMLGGVFFSLAPLTIYLTSMVGVVTTFTIFGVYFGFGMPLCMGYFANSTTAENRARMGGIIFFSVGVGFFLLGSLNIADIIVNAGILSVFRATGLALILILKLEEKPFEGQEKKNYLSIVANKSFLLYFMPWLMFSIVNYLTVPVISTVYGDTLVQYASIVENILIGVFAVFGGFLADIFGRKRLSIIGFAMLGIGYAIVGIYPTQNNIFGLYFYTFVDGIAWGTFSVIFLTTLWGDLGQGRNADKYYAIGALPYLLSNFVRLAAGTAIAEVAGSAVFSFASFFLFLAVLPLAYAPETLPEKVMKDRDLRSYVDKAMKKAQKESEKLPMFPEPILPTESAEPESEFAINVETDDDYEEAKRLAEKYY